MWKRREVLGGFATGLAGLAVVANNSADAAGQPSEGDPKHAGTMSACCDTCGECARACNKAFHHCVEQAAAGKPRHAKMAQIVADCAAFCALSAEMIARNSTLMALSCRACADACRRCARECEASDKDSVMKTCLEACERCEESCRNMVKAMGDGSATAPKAS
jgi:hypothetical protein